jgi:hypothetical protein
MSSLIGRSSGMLAIEIGHRGRAEAAWPDPHDWS